VKVKQSMYMHELVTGIILFITKQLFYIPLCISHEI